MRKKEERFSATSKQAKGDGRIPKDPDVPRKGTNPKDDQDKLPQKKEQEYLKDELEEFKSLYKKLSDKMLPMVYELGFLRK